MFPYILASFLGIIVGSITGIIPGIHPNLMATLSVALFPLIQKQVSTPLIVIFIFSMALTHTFLNIIPTTFLGAPDGDTALSVQPVHKLLQDGRGISAIYLNVVGSFLISILIISSSYILIKTIPLIDQTIKPFIPYILIVVSLIFIFQEKENKIIALCCFLTAGVLGIVVLNSMIEEPLLPLFAGLFGIPSLLYALTTKARVPKQTTEKIILKRKHIQTVLYCFFLGPVFSVLPSLGPAQAALVVNQLQKEKSEVNYIISTGCLNTLHAIIGLFTVYTLGKSRSGIMVAIQEITTIRKELLFVLISVALIIIGAATILTIIFSKIIAQKVTKIRPTLMNGVPIILIIGLVALLSKGFGLIVLITASALGCIPILKNIRRSNVMGVLILPVILLYLL